MEVKLKSINDPDVLRCMATELWQLLDNIDTLDDACRDSDETFRNLARKCQQARHQILTSDGYELFLPDTKEANNGNSTAIGDSND